MKSVPYFSQRLRFTCGPACLRMLAAAHNLRRSETQWERLAKTHTNRGTTRRNMVSALRSMGFSPRSSSGGTVADLQNLTTKGTPVIINYREPSEDCGHFAIVTAVRGANAILQDPWNGKDFVVDTAYLMRKWLGYKTRNPLGGWMLFLAEGSKRA